MTSPLSPREQNEVARSRSKASKIVLKSVDLSRFLKPQASTSSPLEYAFYLLGDAEGKTVLDLGCGSGEQLIPILHRGAKVMGLDISPDMIAIAARRLNDAGLSANLAVRSAYDTELPDGSVDAIFCISLIHHLDIPRTREEMRRILRPGGFIVLKEPIRFSKTYDFLRRLLPEQEDISAYEHPLDQDAFRAFQEGFECEGLRFFRLPFVPLAERLVPAAQGLALRFSNHILKWFPAASYLTTIAVTRLRKPVS